MKSQGCSQTLFLSLLELPEQDFPPVTWGEMGGGGGISGFLHPSSLVSARSLQGSPLTAFSLANLTQ